jgi:hypothetical protein
MSYGAELLSWSTALDSSEQHWTHLHCNGRTVPVHAGLAAAVHTVTYSDGLRNSAL